MRNIILVSVIIVLASNALGIVYAQYPTHLRIYNVNGEQKAKLQRMANKLQAKVCACTGDVNGQCNCIGKWVCVKQNRENDKVLKEREKHRDIPKKKKK